MRFYELLIAFLPSLLNPQSGRNTAECDPKAWNCFALQQHMLCPKLYSSVLCADGVTAVIDEVIERGIVDGNRIACGGHSYGAFMTANILAHCGNRFACGLAHSGAYNRTLTPFGFQAEQRTFWQAPEVYASMAPFNNAEKIKKPILLVHGEADNNTGALPACCAQLVLVLHDSMKRWCCVPVCGSRRHRW